ncbi:MAG: hypothetical protein PHR19_02495 [Bacteroidales bacterium]|nr:hypothetical protein [Bacteroidales bacterium]
MSISDQVFKDALDAAYKAQGMTKAQRNVFIFTDMMEPMIKRNEIIEIQEERAIDHQAAKKASKKVRSEFEEQCEFVHWFKKTYPGVVIMSIRNGGSRSPRERVDQIREGLHPGAADLFIPAWMLWIEFKRVKGGVLSEEQKDFKDYVCNNNYCWLLAEGFESGKEQVENFLYRD